MTIPNFQLPTPNLANLANRHVDGLGNWTFGSWELTSITCRCPASAWSSDRWLDRPTPPFSHQATAPER